MRFALRRSRGLRRSVGGHTDDDCGASLSWQNSQDHRSLRRRADQPERSGLRRISLAIRATEALHASTGASLSLSNRVQRARRDASAVGRHVSMNWDAVGTMYGQLAPG